MWIQIVRHSSLSVDYSAILFPACSCVQLRDHFLNIATKKWSRPTILQASSNAVRSLLGHLKGRIPRESLRKIVHSFILIFFFPPTIFFDQQFTLNLKTQLLFPFTDDLLIKNIFLTNFLLSNIFHDFPVELRILQQKNKNGTKLVELKNSCIVNQYY